MPAATVLPAQRSLALRAAAYTAPRALYVLDKATGLVDVLKNKSYAEIGSISDGGTPFGVALDRSGNVYVANTAGRIDEFPPNSNTPSFTYNAGMSSAFEVTVDNHGDVFEVDKSSINEYYQGVNQVLYTCSISPFPSGIAVDSNNDVFVGVGGSDQILEFVGGLRGCNPTVLGVSIQAYGMAVDKAGNLVVCGPGTVDVIAPPYTSVTRTIGSGWVSPWTVAISRDNKYAFVTDINDSREVVQVVNYQTGANVTTLGGGNGLVQPIAAVDGPNAVY
ncbi:MAG: hypothetical protein JO078_10140 [Candidatus Eremiobacteraeota bacterium]|nr:hypothetical protein [Candidatus Eremiobacteraeota bacterium]MBV9057254.1 hypothetical protein [Candidatus Eremiobacteraeota bacterium]MBV9700469.1 hypothetical protein [Candidatus Eremiobacteraeota bacterium]